MWKWVCSACAAFIASVCTQCYRSHSRFCKQGASAGKLCKSAMATWLPRGKKPPLPPDESLQAWHLGNVKLCKFHIEGCCRRENFCKYARSLLELVNP